MQDFWELVLIQRLLIDLQALPVLMMMHGEYEFFDKVYLFLLRPTWEIIQAHVPKKKYTYLFKSALCSRSWEPPYFAGAVLSLKNASGARLAKIRDFYQL